MADIRDASVSCDFREASNGDRKMKRLPLILRILIMPIIILATVVALVMVIAGTPKIKGQTNYGEKLEEVEK